MNYSPPKAVVDELEKRAHRHGEMSVYPKLVTQDGIEFMGKYVAHLGKAGIAEEEMANMCVDFSRRCQDAWLDYHRARLAKDDARNWSHIAAAFEAAMQALDEAGADFENVVELYGRLNKQNGGAGLREQLQRATEHAHMDEAHFNRVTKGPRTEARRFARHLATACNAIPQIPLPTQPMIASLIYLVYGVRISNSEIGSAMKAKG